MGWCHCRLLRNGLLILQAEGDPTSTSSLRRAANTRRMHLPEFHRVSGVS